MGVVQVLLLLSVFALARAQLDPNAWCVHCHTRRWNQLDYYGPAIDCPTYYFHCQKLFNGSFTAVRQDCQSGFYWRQDLLQCVPFYEGGCLDPCRLPDVAWTGAHSSCSCSPSNSSCSCNCASYYACSNFRSVKACCPDYHSFDAMTGQCTYDETCTPALVKDCIGPWVQPPTPGPAQQLADGSCVDPNHNSTLHKADSSSVYFFSREVNDTNWVRQRCASGSSWNQDMCQCTNEGPTIAPVQPSDLVVDVLFTPTADGRVTDQSSNNYQIFCAAGVPFLTTGNNYVGQFFSQKWCEIPALQTLDLGVFTIQFWLWPVADNASHTVLSNEGTDGQSVVAYTSNGVIYWSVKFAPLGEVRNLAAPVAVGAWNLVTLTFDGSTLTLYVNCISIAHVAQQGRLFWMAHCPWTLGWGLSYSYGNQYLDNFDVYRAAKDTSFICPIAANVPPSI